MPDLITVALVEDDVDLAEEIGFQLEHHGMCVTVFQDGQALDSWLKENTSAVVVLDLNLPGEDGLSIAKRLLTRTDLRIVMLTARVMMEDRVAGFDAGADVYLQKPVHLAELVAVIQQQGKRLQKESPKGWLLKTTGSLLVTPNGETIKLTSGESRFLQLLSQAKTHYLTRVYLENALWRLSDIHTARRLEVLVSRLRSKLLNHGLIQTYRGEGYGLMAPLLL